MQPTHQQPLITVGLGVTATEVLRKPKTGWIISACSARCSRSAFSSGRKRHFTPSVQAQLPQESSLAILPFRNASGDASLDWLSSSLAEILSTDVGQSPELRTVSPDRLHQLFGDLKSSSSTTVLDQGTLHRIAEFTNADRIVWRDTQSLVSRFASRRRLRMSRTDTSATLTELAKESTAFAAIDHLARGIRLSWPLSRSVMKELESQAFKPSTTSIAAMREYDNGLQLERNGEFSCCCKTIRSGHKGRSEISAWLFRACQDILRPRPG